MKSCRISDSWRETTGVRDKRRKKIQSLGEGKGFRVPRAGASEFFDFGFVL